MTNRLWAQGADRLNPGTKADLHSPLHKNECVIAVLPGSKRSRTLRVLLLLLRRRELYSFWLAFGQASVGGVGAVWDAAADDLLSEAGQAPVGA